MPMLPVRATHKVGLSKAFMCCFVVVDVFRLILDSERIRVAFIAASSCESLAENRHPSGGSLPPTD